MQAFDDVLRFELRLHSRSAMFWGIALIFFVLHLLTLTRTGINLGDNEQVAINSASLIFQTHVVLGLFGMLPAIIFAVTALTRDAERRMTELFFTTPVPRTAFLLGRFAAGALAAIAIGCFGVLGALVGSFMPWLEPSRVAPFDWRPWAAVLTLIVLPNVVVFSALFFSVAALTRSSALTFGAALGVLVLDLLVNFAAAPPVPRWLPLFDPIGALPVFEASRYWTVSELNTQLPTALLGPNRVLWLGIALAALLVTLWRYRMELAPPHPLLRLRARSLTVSVRPPVAAHALPAPRFHGSAPVRQFLSQVRMDWRGVWQSPLYWLVLAMAAAAVWAEASALELPVLHLPLLPATALLLDFPRVALIQYVLLAIIYFSAALVFRERDSGVDGITGAAPWPDWIAPVSKTLVLFGIALSLLAVSMLVALGVQELEDFHDHEIGVLVESLFVHAGFYFFMLCVLAVLVQLLSPSKWSGMVFVLLAFVAVLAMPAVGLEHLLYGFRIPVVVYSDMNGFGHFRVQTYTLIAYWGAFCGLLLVAGHLLFPRGSYSSWRERLHDARSRLTAPLVRTCVAAVVLFASFGAFVFYNTNVLNEYITTDKLMSEQARYELEYGRYRDAPWPSLVDPDVRLELYPSERRWESRGTAGLRNGTAEPIGDFVVSVNPLSRVEELRVDGATLAMSDPRLGFYQFRPAAPIAPGATLTMHWTLVQDHEGFPNAVFSDPEIVANGSYVRLGHMPSPGYCTGCELATRRARYGLPAADRLPPLGDTAHIDEVFPGFNLRSSFRFVIGTEADQTAVAAGELRRTWEENGRRYFEYGLGGPAWPALAALSARYTIARDDWNGVALEIYYDARHPWNIPTMQDTAKKGLEYYSREFGPYALPYYRMAEYARYTMRVQAGLGVIAYAEGSGFLTDLRGGPGLDVVTLHELAHQWWGASVYGARMQGREVLNEGLAQYSTFMMLKEHADPVWVRRYSAEMNRSYLAARGSGIERPVVQTDDQPHISYGKAPVVLFALQELIGAAKVNGALRAYHARFAGKGPPFPTSLDLVAELRAAAGPEHDKLITDLFEKIVLHEVSVAAAETRRVGDGYEVTIDIAGKQLEATGEGAEQEVPLDTWFQIAVFPVSDRDVVELDPLYIEHHRLQTGTQRITVRVAEEPGSVAVDPFYLMIDRNREDNVVRLR